MKILVIGQSARDHAVVETLRRSASQPEIVNIATSVHPQLKDACAKQYVVDSLVEIADIVPIAVEMKPDVVYIGPEEPIVAGLADALGAAGLRAIAPSAAHARLEGSKSFMRDLLTKNGLPTPKYRSFFSPDEKPITDYMLRELGGDFVVKYDGLKGAHGVRIMGDHLVTTDEAVKFARTCMREHGGVLIEERLRGCEFSLHSAVAGDAVIHMPPVQTYKRALEGDDGSLTYGMGAYVQPDHLLPYLSADGIRAAQDINARVIEALNTECGSPFVGFLCGEFILTKDGLKVIEFNVRFGDPDAQCLLSILSTDLAAVFEAMAGGILSADALSFERKASVAKYIVPASYPDDRREIGDPFFVPNVAAGTTVYFGDVTRDKDGALLLGASRTASIVATAPSVNDAETAVQSLCQRVAGSVRYRHDIATAQLMQKYTAYLQSLRTQPNA